MLEVVGLLMHCMRLLWLLLLVVVAVVHSLLLLLLLVVGICMLLGHSLLLLPSPLLLLLLLLLLPLPLHAAGRVLTWHQLHSLLLSPCSCLMANQDIAVGGATRRPHRSRLLQST